MSIVNITNIEVLDNPTKFTNPFQFEITFTSYPPAIKKELEWKITYVGCPDDEKFDQDLDTVLVGPVKLGKNKFVFQSPAPNPALFPSKQLLDITVIMLSCAYSGQTFIQVGYYVSNYYIDEKFKNSSPAVYAHAYRNINTKPRVTRFDITWDKEPVKQSLGPFEYLAERKIQDYREVAPKEEDHLVDKDEPMDVEEDIESDHESMSLQDK